jgi:hypothetical protein
MALQRIVRRLPDPRVEFPLLKGSTCGNLSEASSAAPRLVTTDRPDRARKGACADDSA